METRNHRGGRETNLFVGSVDEDLLCAICHNVFVEPKEISSCGHIFCNSCISAWISRYFIIYLFLKRRSASCAICRVSTNSTSMRNPSVTLKKIIGKLQAFCDNKENGCPWKSDYSNLASHLPSCKYKQGQSCSHCGNMIFGESLEEHLKKCRNQNKVSLEQEVAKQIKNLAAAYEKRILNLEQTIQNQRADIQSLTDRIEDLERQMMDSDDGEDEEEHSEEQSDDENDVSAFRIYVSNLPFSLTDEELAQHLSLCNIKYESCEVISRRDGRNKGFGFVQTPAYLGEHYRDSVIPIIQMWVLEGRRINAEPARN